MRVARWLGMVLMLLTVIVALGCSQPGTPKTAKGPDKTATPKEDDHDHGPGPHGGAVADWGGGKYHVEFTVNHDTQEATVYILDSKVKNAAPIKADKLLLTIKEPPFQTDLKALPQETDPKGASSRFVGKHEKLATVREFAGTVSGEVDGTPYAGDFKEEPEEKKPAKK